MEKEIVELNERLSEFESKLSDSDKFQARFADLEGKLKEGVLVTKLENDLKIEHDLLLKHFFGNAQNLKLVTTLREEDECLKKRVFEPNEEKTVFESKFVSSQSRVMNLSKQVSR